MGGVEKIPTDVLKEIVQIGVVVPDLDKAIASVKRILGIEPDWVEHFHYTGVVYRGESVRASARVASYDHFGVNLEYMEPTGPDKSMWQDYLDIARKNGYAMQHVRFSNVPDNDEVTAVLAGRGIEVYQEGDSVVNPDCKFTYYDTAKELGFVIEVLTEPKKD